MTRPETVEEWIGALESADLDRRRWATEWLYDHPEAQAVDALIRVVHDVEEASGTRSYAARALAKIGDVRAFLILSALRSDEDTNVRFAAISALGQTKDTRSFDPLATDLARNVDPLIRAAAATGLGYLGDARAVGLLVSALLDQDEYVRICAIGALGRLAPEQAVEPLTRIVQDHTHSTAYERTQAARALSLIKST